MFYLHATSRTLIFCPNMLKSWFFARIYKSPSVFFAPFVTISAQILCGLLLFLFQILFFVRSSLVFVIVTLNRQWVAITTTNNNHDGRQRYHWTNKKNNVNNIIVTLHALLMPAPIGEGTFSVFKCFLSFVILHLSRHASSFFLPTYHSNVFGRLWTDLSPPNIPNMLSKRYLFPILPQKLSNPVEN